MQYAEDLLMVIGGCQTVFNETLTSSGAGNDFLSKHLAEQLTGGII